MTVKRTRDPLGIIPERVEIDASTGDDAENGAAWREVLRRLTVEARIERCNRHPELVEPADSLRRRALELGAATREGWMDWQFRAQFEELEKTASWLDAAALHPLALRDTKRQDGTRKERRPEINEWIKTQLKFQPAAKSPALWARAPEWITDQIGCRRFAARVSACRKALAEKRAQVISALSRA